MSAQGLPSVRRLRVREEGAIHKDWGGRIPIALVYPNSYHLGMSNLGVHALYALFNSHPQVVCERFFYKGPEAGDESGLGGPGASATDRGAAGSDYLPLSIESSRPLTDFAVIALSISYELDYFHIAPVLEAAGIPVFAAERDSSHPLVVAGGPCVMANPMPIAPFCDALAIGEGEVLVPPLVQALTRHLPPDREAVLAALATTPGWLVPFSTPASSANYPRREPVVRQWAGDLDAFATTSVVLTPDTEFADTFLIEVARGCGRGCRFCLAGFLFRPFRKRSLGVLQAQAEAGLRRTRRIGLLGAAVADHPQLEELVAWLHRQGAQVSISSLRLDALSEGLVAALVASGARTLTLAPEAGSERLRRAIHKTISNAQVLAAAEMIARHRVLQVRLYFMVGLPTETEADIQSIIELSLEIKGRLPSTRLSLQLGPFVPKAGTPFQAWPMAPARQLRQRQGAIARALRPRGILVRAESPEWSAVQGVLARGDERLARAIARLPRPTLATWHHALEAEGLDPAMYLHREWTGAQPPPWSVVDTGVGAGFLDREATRALETRG